MAGFQISWRTGDGVYYFRLAALAAGGRFGPAIDNYRRALEVDPKLDPALYNLAWLLATCPEEELRRPGKRSVWCKRLTG